MARISAIGQSFFNFYHFRPFGKAGLRVDYPQLSLPSVRLRMMLTPCRRRWLPCTNAPTPIFQAFGTKNLDIEVYAQHRDGCHASKYEKLVTAKVIHATPGSFSTKIRSPCNR